MTGEEKENIKYKLSDIGKQVGELALEYISELEKENAELKAQIEELQLNLRSRKDLVEELTMQIEKMKNVGNCKHAMQCPDWVEHKIKDDGIKPCLNCIKWELEE